MKKLKSDALKLLTSCLYRLRLRNQRGFRILTYHSVQDHPDSTWHTPPAVFDQHMQYLHESGYRTSRIADIINQWPAILEEKGVSLTFDDGLSNNFTVVCDILKKYDMTATFFITTEFIGQNRTYPSSEGMSYFRDTTMLSWNDIRSMCQAGFEIGSHSHSHQMITRLPKADAYSDIATSKRLLEAELGTQVISFSYPYGLRNAYAQWTKTILLELGFKAGCSQMGGALSNQTDLLELPRTGMRGSDSLDVLKHKLAGAYDFLRWIQ